MLEPLDAGVNCRRGTLRLDPYLPDRGGVAEPLAEARDRVDDGHLLRREIMDGWLGGDDLIAQRGVCVGRDIAEPLQHLQRSLEPFLRGPQRPARLVGQRGMVPLLGDPLEEPENLPIEGVRAVGHGVGS
jgi:hypothetical protein